MELANTLYQFFGFDTLGSSATFIDLLQSMLKIGCGMWLTIFIIRSMFMALTIPEKGF